MLHGPRPYPQPPDRGFLLAEVERLLSFAVHARDPAGGFAPLDAQGRPKSGEPTYTWLTARMTHAFALGQLLGFDTGLLVDHGVNALQGRLRDRLDGGWFTEVQSHGTSASNNESYSLAHVILAASSAVEARHPNAHRLLDDALTVLSDHFWDASAGAVVDSWSRGWLVLDPYRGANANMHTVEGLLAASAATESPMWLNHARRILERFVNHAARDNGWRMPEHYSSGWEPDRSYNEESPFDMFKPFGVTPGHLFEWAKLCCQASASLGSSAPEWLLEGARALFSRAVADGWAVDGAPGFVYTVDWGGAPRGRQRLHWVLAEAIAAATLLSQMTGEAAYGEWYRTWWRFADAFVIDRQAGSWHHELSPANEPDASIVSGKPDIYHAIQACLYPLVRPAASLASELARERGTE